MKKLILIVVASVVASMLTSCYKHTVCATYTNNIENTELVKSNDKM